MRNLAIFDHRKRSLVEYDDLMTDIKSGPYHMQDDMVMQIVKDQLHRFDGELYDLIAYSIMSNHVHILVDTLETKESEILEAALYNNNTDLSYILKRIKGSTGRYANKKLGRVGAFWHKENYDIYIRNEKMLKNVIGYILDNPVKAGIVGDWKEYTGNYCMSSEF